MIDVLVRIVRLVLAHEPVVRARAKGLLGMQPVGFVMARRPSMVETGAAADPAIVKREDLLALRVQVEVGARELATRAERAREPIHALMVVWPTLRAAGRACSTRRVES